MLNSTMLFLLLNFNSMLSPPMQLNAESILFENQNISNLNIASYSLKTISSSNINELFYILKEADRINLPKKIVRNDGGISYLYKLREGQRKLSIEEIEYLISNPPKYIREMSFINSVVNRLEGLGVRISIGNLKSKKASAEWLPYQKMIRVNPDIFQSGTLAFAEVLNHEIIHVAQSCFAGRINNKPKLLGISKPLKNHHRKLISTSIYSNLNKEEKELEAEAYSLQGNLPLGYWLLSKYCFAKS